MCIRDSSWHSRPRVLRQLVRKRASSQQSRDVNPVDYRQWRAMQQRVHQVSILDAGEMRCDLLRHRLIFSLPGYDSIKSEWIWKTVSRMMRLISGEKTGSKVKYPYICIALYYDSSLKRSGMARVNEGSHSFTCHPHVYPQVEWNIPAFTPQPQSITAVWLVLISRPAEGRRLSWPRWLGEILRWFIHRRRSPNPSTQKMATFSSSCEVACLTFNFNKTLHTWLFSKPSTFYGNKVNSIR